MSGHAIADRLLDAYMLWQAATLRAPLLRAARRCEATQRAVLHDIVRANAATRFGRDHGFAAITDADEYRRRVPVQTYDSLEPYMREQQAGAPALTAEPPVYYARTSGTSGRSKDIPLTRHGLDQVSAAQRLLAVSLWRDTGFFRGSVLGMASPVVEGWLPNGAPYGATSGQAFRSLPQLLARKFAIPRETFAIDDVEAKYQLYALAALAADDVSGIVAANPSSLLKLQAVILADTGLLLAALSARSAAALHPSAAAQAEAVLRRVSPSRLRALQDAVARYGTLRPDDIWPNLSAVATWTGGSCGVALDHLRAGLPGGVAFVEYGYAASEFMGAATVDARAGICLPLLDRHFYEFVPRREWDAGRPTFLGLHEIVPGEDYYIFITTRSGLYRYDINDIVRAGAGRAGCPGLAFVQKGRGVTSITGEKLSEHQLVAAVAGELTARRLHAVSYIALADAATAGYTLYLECSERFDGDTLADSLADSLDWRLRTLNSEYDDKRKGGRLVPLRVCRLRAGAGEALKRVCLARGVREAQYKPVLLDEAAAWTAVLAPLVAAAGDDNAP